MELASLAPQQFSGVGCGRFANVVVAPVVANVVVAPLGQRRRTAGRERGYTITTSPVTAADSLPSQTLLFALQLSEEARVALVGALGARRVEDKEIDVLGVVDESTPR